MSKLTPFIAMTAVALVGLGAGTASADDDDDRQRNNGYYNGGGYGDRYQGDRYQGDRYQGDRYQGDRYQGDRYDAGDRVRHAPHRGYDDRHYDAGAAADYVARRIHTQRQRIDRAWRQGWLSRGKTRKLVRRQRALEHRFARFCDDGYLSPDELRVMKTKLDKASRKIAHSVDKRRRRAPRYRHTRDHRRWQAAYR